MQTGVRCPRCALPLFEGKTSAVVMYGCGGCGGLWLDNQGSQRIVEVVDDEVAELASRAEDNATCPVDTAAAGLLCPQCDGVMRRVRMSKAKLDLDICDQHGTWFDRGELQRVMNACAGRSLPMLPAYAPMAVAVPDGRGGYVPESYALGAAPARGADAAIIAGGVLALAGALLGGSRD